MKFFIVDDHPVVIRAVSSLLENEGHIVVGSSTDGFQSVSKIKDLEPEAVIIDIDVPKLDGFSIMSRVFKFKPTMVFLIYSGTKNSEMPKRSFQAGAAGYVSKEEDMSGLLDACIAITNGRTWFTTDTLKSVRTKDFNTPEGKLVSTLSARESAVMLRLVNGYSNKEISEEMSLSTKTISTYKSRVLEKLNIKGLIELSEFAKRNNII